MENIFNVGDLYRDRNDGQVIKLVVYENELHGLIIFPGDNYDYREWAGTHVDLNWFCYAEGYTKWEKL